MVEENKLRALFTQHFAQSPQSVAYAPGRVNIIGDHTDYNEGFVLPAAINFGTHVIAAKRRDTLITIVAVDYNHEEVSFDLASIDFDENYPWSNYVRGVLIELKKSGANIGGANLLVSGNVPQGAGLSSSASFEIAVVKAFCQLYQLSVDGIQAALIGQQAENNFVGCRCGIMDQLISALGKASSALLLDCRRLTYDYAKLPEQMVILIVNSNVRRTLVGSEYNTRREQCEQVAAYFKKPALRDVTLTALLAAKQELDQQDPLLFKRAHHVITENERTLSALTALNKNDLPTLSQLMAASHVSLKEDFEVTTPELDLLVNILSKTLGEQGGVRMTGGGFGGCVVALMPERLLAKAKASVVNHYEKQTGIKPTLYLCSAEQGAFTTL